MFSSRRRYQFNITPCRRMFLYRINQYMMKWVYNIKLMCMILVCRMWSMLMIKVCRCLGMNKIIVYRLVYLLIMPVSSTQPSLSLRTYLKISWTLMNRKESTIITHNFNNNLVSNRIRNLLKHPKD